MYAQVWGEHWSGRSRPVRTDDNGQSAFNVRAGSDVIFFVWGDDRNPNVNDQTAVSGIAPGNATFPVINNNLPTFTTNRLLGPIVQDGVTYYGVQLAWNNIGYAAHRGYLMCVRLRATQELFELNFHEGNLTSYDSGYWDIAGCDFYLMAFDTNGTVYARRLIVIP